MVVEPLVVPSSEASSPQGTACPHPARSRSARPAPQRPPRKGSRRLTPPDGGGAPRRSELGSVQPPRDRLSASRTIAIRPSRSATTAAKRVTPLDASRWWWSPSSFRARKRPAPKGPLVRIPHDRDPPVPLRNDRREKGHAA